jgi:two-component system response regulator PilR (NtrC family)
MNSNGNECVFQGMVFKSGGKMQEVCADIERIAGLDTTVLITGESGVGKELAANAIHNLSPRHGKFVIVDCGALKEEMLESDLFGHNKGSFTTALCTRQGLVESAGGGTVLIDEVSELPFHMQARLLRLIEDKTFRRIGSNEYIKVNVRFVVATNKDLSTLVGRKEFREDLFYRLKHFSIEIPPLRSRKEDIPVLTKHFVCKFQSEHRKEYQGSLEGLTKVVLQMPWMGNVRELKHTIESEIIKPFSVLNAARIIEMCESAESTADGEKKDGDSRGLGLRGLMEEQERILIKDAISRTGSKVGAAKRLKLPRSTLEHRIRTLGIK